VGEYRMPSLGADMDRGTLLEWKVRPGDMVHRGDIIAVVDTDKSDIDVEVFEDGVVERIVVPEGEEVPVGTVLAILGAPPEDAAGPPAETTTARSAVAAEPEPPVAPGPPPPPAPGPVAGGHHVSSPLVRHLAERAGLDLDALEGTGPGGRVTRHDVERALPADAPAGRVPAPAAAPSRREGGRVPSSPVARRRAAELDVDLAGVTGTGPGGAVRLADVEGAATGAPAAADAPAATDAPAAPAPHAGPPVAPDRRGGDAERDRAAARRDTTAKLMARSNREIPHYYLRTTVDLLRARAWLDECNRERPVAGRLLPSVLLLRATALAVAEVPDLNGHWVDDRLVRHDAVDLGVAVALRGGGLVAPTIHAAETRTVDELMADLRDLVARARAGRLLGSQLTDPTITVTNLGDQGVEEVFGVIYPPQVALVGFGRIGERPWAEQGMLTVRPAVTATLAADHRVTSGHQGARFLTALDRLLQHPEEL
jgi:pyruvate dehydrogenase E2 component (dihydrolipoamide acetyltransferase)